MAENLHVAGQPANLERGTMAMKVIRADGTEEDLGVVSIYVRPRGWRGFLVDVRDAYRKARDGNA